jgi:hypothetical protein
VRKISSLEKRDLREKNLENSGIEKLGTVYEGHSCQQEDSWIFLPRRFIPVELLVEKDSKGYK